jgi:hypothetical protein
MINKFDVQEKLPHLDALSSEKVASDINLIASQFNIDRDQILNLLSKDPNDLSKQIADINMRRQQTKVEIRNIILK